jgi:hypothetical protein
MGLLFDEPGEGTALVTGTSTYQRGTTSARAWSRDGSRRVFTRRYRTVYIALFSFIGGIVAAGPTSEILDAQSLRWALASVTAGTVLICYRVFRLGIVAEPGRLVVRNYVRWHALTSKEIDRFEPPSEKAFALRTGLRLIRRDGRQISCSAFSRMNQFESPDRGCLEAAELNAWLEDERNDVLPLSLEPRCRLTRPQRFWWRLWLGVLVLEIILILGLVLPLLADPSLANAP